MKTLLIVLFLFMFYSVAYGGSSSDFSVNNNYLTYTAGNVITTNTPFTFSIWIYLDAYTDNFPEITLFDSDTANGFTIFLGNTAYTYYNGVNFGCSDNTQWARMKDVANNMDIFLTKWKHIAVTYNGKGATDDTNFVLYIDGVVETHSDQTEIFLNTPAVNRISFGADSTAEFDGKMVFYELYPRVFTINEIKKIMINPLSFGTATVKFSLMAQENSWDLSGNNKILTKTGTINNSTLFPPAYFPKGAL